MMLGIVIWVAVCLGGSGTYDGLDVVVKFFAIDFLVNGCMKVKGYIWVD